MSQLAAYLARIGLGAPPPADARGLATLQQAHRRAIGFENLDIPLGRPIRIDRDAAFAKLVLGGRGGYCFEHNRLYADVLAALGYAARPLLARVWLGLDPAADPAPPRTHTLLLADIAGTPWIADAGFGGSYVPPLPLREADEVATADGARHRLRRPAAGEAGDAEWLLERAGPASATDGRSAAHYDWQPQYGFTLAPVAPADLELSNHWTSTRPATRFTTLRIASIALPDGFASLNDRRLSLHRGGTAEARDIGDAAEYRSLLSGLFRIELSDEEVAALGLF
ncbi:MAG: arylamine N-acetyltransferase [Sphingomonadales bacterium]|nr:arylamine N-acetyltransferase [Sphingomonadales bacterium]